MTADELASPRYEGTDEALEQHRSERRPRGADTVHHAPVWHADGALTLADTTHTALAEIMLRAAAEQADQ